MLPSRQDHPQRRCALDLVCASPSSPLTVRVHDGDDCCSHAPACCPLLGSDHFLCVCARFLRVQVSDVPRVPLPRDWRSTLLRACNQLSVWAEKVWRQSSSQPSSRGGSDPDSGRIVLSILAPRAPLQKLSHQRHQQSWWKAVCFAACVARNGAWRTTTGCVLKSRTARQQFHRTVRGRFGKIMSPLCQHTTRGLPQRQFDELSSAAPIPAKLSVCSGLTFQTLHQGTTEWHSGGSSFRGKFRWVRFSQPSSAQGVGSFDGPFSPSELRRALRSCVDSAVGLDGVPHSLLKVPFLGGISSFLSCLGAWFVLCGNGASWCTSSTERRRSCHQLSPHLFRFVLLQAL